MTWSHHPPCHINLWSSFHVRSPDKFRTLLHETYGYQAWHISGFRQEATNHKVKWLFDQVVTCDKFTWQIKSGVAPHQGDIWLTQLIRLLLKSHHSQSHMTIRLQSHMASCEAIFTFTRFMVNQTWQSCNHGLTSRLKIKLEKTFFRIKKQWSLTQNWWLWTSKFYMGSLSFRIEFISKTELK